MGDLMFGLCCLGLFLLYVAALVDSNREHERKRAGGGEGPVHDLLHGLRGFAEATG